MSSDNAALEHFRAGRKALVDQREQIDRAIDDVDRVIRTLTRDVSLSEGGKGTDTLSVQRSSNFGSVHDAILAYAANVPEFDVPGAVKFVHANGLDAQEKSVRSTMSVMNRDGELTRIRRGAYRLAASPANAESAPAATETLSDFHPNSQEGGTAHGTVVRSGVRDDDPGWQPDHHDHPVGASVVEASR